MSTPEEVANRRGITELRRMDETEARQTLTVEEYERWEKLNQLHDEADANRAEWADQDQRVADITVHADKRSLGTRVDLYGNDVLVHVDGEDEELRAAADALDDEYGDLATDEVAHVDDVDAERLGELFMDLLDVMIVEWNGHAWDDLDGETRRGVLQSAREKWGLEGLVMAKVDIVAAVEEDRDERLDVIEKFRAPERRGRR